MAPTERTTAGEGEMRGRAMRCPRLGCPDQLVPLGAPEALPANPTYWVRDDRPGRWIFSHVPPLPMTESESEWAYRCEKCGATFRKIARI